MAKQNETFKMNSVQISISATQQVQLNGAKILLPFFLLFALNACAPHPSGSADSFSSQAVNSAGVIGGAAVERNSFFEQKVLYLALGVQKQKDSAGTTQVSWKGLCTASALSTHVILTAAHCVKDRSAAELFIVLNSNPGTAALDLNQWHSVQNVRVHPLYVGEADGFLNDLALLQLSDPVSSDQVLEMDDGKQITSPEDLISVGYGTTSDISDSAQASASVSGLHYVMRSIQNYDPNSKTFSITQTDHKGFCNGDSGGPGLVFDSATRKLKILGVVSNTSMLDSERNQLDPQRQFSLCIGHGNYTNIAEPNLRKWIDETQKELQ